MASRAVALPALLLAAACLCAGLLGAPAPARAQDTPALQQTIDQEKARAEASRAKVLRLTKRERELYSDLAGVEDELDGLHRDLAAKEAELAAIDARLARSRRDYQSLAGQRDRAMDELRRLSAALWPLYIQRRLGATRRDTSWEDADRRLVWTGAVNDDVRESLRQVREQSREMQAAMARREQLRTQAARSLEAVDAAKRELLSKRLAFVSRIREVRAERISQEQALAQIMAAIEDLDLRLQSITGRRFADAKGSLPWPAPGRRLPDADLQAGAKGLGLKVAEGQPVRAVFWGKVVYDDVLRGFGRVIILSHGDNYYSLYAFLRDSQTAVGREVEKGETLGRAGFYPPASGPGVYFELRLGQKPITPDQWFATPRPLASGD